jgi:(1->4)-alpha-D-glucan 1-alpha-D-glucosylmutase
MQPSGTRDAPCHTLAPFVPVQAEIHGKKTRRVMASDVPLSTYRLQLTKHFGFDDAAALVPYLKELGITHLYTSPFLKARPSSTHGYDIVDHDRLNPELGGDKGFARLSAALKEHALGLILDFVPNHMGVGSADNVWWLDVLEWGPGSPHARFFDIDWNALPHRRHPGVLLPILGRPYGEALQGGEIQLKYDPTNGTFAAWYFQHKLPINPQRYGEIVRTIVGAAHAGDDKIAAELIALADDYRDPRAPSYREATQLKRRLRDTDGATAVIERGLEAYNGKSETGAAMLHRLLERQHYRIAYWRVAVSAVNYRRFFDINDLAGVRVEDPATFRAIHSLVTRLIAADQLQGLRLDHIDGLRDPAQYTKRLTQLIRKLRREAGLSASFYIIVEKILANDEPMPRFPGVAGTTGYEWLNMFSHVLVEGRGLTKLDATYREFTGEQRDFAAMLDAAKQHVIETILASEFGVLCGALSRIAAGHFSTRDFTIDRLRAALRLYVLEFPVYRTYVTAGGASEQDRRLIEDIVTRARERWRGPDPQIFDFLRDAVTLDLAANPRYSAPRVREFALKLQQFTGPLMAKAMEDTAFYRYQRLIAFNEVGGDPTLGELALASFHERQRLRSEAAGQGLTTTATHDTKRGEDARARILAIAELAEEWDAGVKDWHSRNAALVQYRNDKRLPSRSHEYMLYQVLVGAWRGNTDAQLVARMQRYALKAAREGKEETDWTDPNEAYETALREFVAGVLDPKISAGFLGSFEEFAARTTLLGALNSLSQLVLKTMLPGAPDFYQGTELWDLSLVDPDNRRPVDFSEQRGFLAASHLSWDTLAAEWRDGRIKLAVTRELLRLRHSLSNLFRQGTYEPIEANGSHARHVIAFARTWKKDSLVVAVGRHFAPLTERGRRWPSVWEATLPLPPGNYVDIFGRSSVGHRNEVSVSSLFQTIPISVMRRA